MKIKYICLFLITIYIIERIIKYNKSVYISTSRINGLGLFAGKDFKKGDIIINNLITSKRNPLNHNKINNSIIREGKYINHCSFQYNSDIITTDNTIYKLIAIKDIKKNKEITGNYDKVNNNFPFIKPSSKHFFIC